MSSEKRDRPAGNGAAPETSGGDGHKGTAPVRPDPAPTTTERVEAAVLGAMLLDDEARTGVPTMLAPDDFARDAHRTAYVAILAVLADGHTPDVLTVTAKLAEHGHLDTVGGPVGVADLCDMDTCPTPASWAAYGALVAREARRRRGIRRLRAALDRLEAGEDPSVVAADLCGEVVA